MTKYRQNLAGNAGPHYKHSLSRAGYDGAERASPLEKCLEVNLNYHHPVSLTAEVAYIPC